ncbi:MAG: 30S ribosomal protein S12 methylthiotransferase RimO [Deltaproteobacteria bacterium]|nr:30S ribosomal protein S12 methylthiotransferase RimO [Deltaproteobacteria bacterium]
MDEGRKLSDPESRGRTIHFVSLGCPKNRVDTERMVALATGQGMRLVADPADSEVIVVNTCGFIGPAKQESVETVLELARHKETGRCRTLVMTGCLSQRYPEELARELPEVDHFLGTSDLPRLGEILSRRDEARLAVGRPEGLAEAEFGRQLLGPAHTAHLKISEGCNRPCAFCIIPLMRGAQRSRTLPSLLEEARTLVASGVRELILVAQDTTVYGSDLAGEQETDLVALLEALSSLEGLVWIRLHYTYPSAVDRRLVEAMATLPKVAPYIDMPLQHVDDEVLRRMRRGYGEKKVRETIALLREAMPKVAIRTTLLTGHPGETDAAHARLLAFLEEVELDHVGVFPFSPEEGTPSHDLPDAVPEKVARARAKEVMALQRKISRRRLKRLRDEVLEVMVDGPSEESEFLLQGRHGGQSPEIDGVVILTDGTAQPGEVVRARVIKCSDYDLVASIEQAEEHAPDGGDSGRGATSR